MPDELEQIETEAQDEEPEAKAATTRNRARGLLRRVESLLDAKDVPAAVRKELRDLRRVLNSTWADLADAAASDEAEEGKSLAVKYLRDQDGGAVVGGPLLLWGNPEQLDLQGEYFTPETQTWHEVYKSVPALFHHGLDSTVGLAVIGRRIKAEARDDGLWVEDWLDKSNEYWAMVQPLLEAEVLYYSPGSAPHLVTKEDDGKLKSYPVVEDTLTPVPAQHRLRPIEQIKAAWVKADLDLPDTLEPEPEPADGGESAGADCQEAEKDKARAIQVLSEIESMEGT